MFNILVFFFHFKWNKKYFLNNSAKWFSYNGSADALRIFLTCWLKTFQNNLVKFI